MLRRTILALCLLTLCLPAGAGALSPAQEALRRAVEMLSESPAIGDEPVADFRLLSDFYARGNFQPAWTDPGKVGEMMVLVRNAGLEGLTPSDYHLEKLEALTAEGYFCGSTGKTVARWPEGRCCFGCRPTGFWFASSNLPDGIATWRQCRLDRGGVFSCWFRGTSRKPICE